MIRYILSEDPANYTEGLIFEDETKALSAYANHQEYGKQSYLFEFHHPDEDSKSPPHSYLCMEVAYRKGSNSMKILQGDCLELMKGIDDQSIDMILCDLPYGTTRCRWDRMIPFEPLWIQYERIIKEKGAIVLFGSQPFTSALVMSKLKMFKYSLVWKKERSTNFLHSKYQFGKCHEDIIIFSHAPATFVRNKTGMKYYPQMDQGQEYTQKQGSIGDVIDGNWDGAKRPKIITQNNGTRYPLSILSFKRDKSKIHPTQKPVGLLEYLIKTYTQEK